MRLRTLGGLILDGSTLRRPKPLLLLAYLAVEGPKDRAHLRELFWPDALEPAVSLRVALGHLKAAGPGAVHTDGDRVALGSPGDVVELLAALREGDFARLPALYGGAFLAGVHVPDWSAELEEWVYGTREFVGGQVRGALVHLAEQDARRGDLAAARQHAEAAFRVAGAGDPEPDELERLLALLLAARSPLAAEARRTAREYGLDLNVTEADADARYAAPAPRVVRAAAAPLVGRAAERDAALSALRAGAPLLTVTGPGGVGKTRLASDVLNAVAADAGTDVATAVSLDTLSVPAELGGAVAAALGLDAHGRVDALEAVATALGTRRAVLALDTFEHLLPAAPLVQQLLTRCPQLSVLVTSREALGLPDELVLPLDGLSTVSAHPDRDPDAVALFVQRARRARLDFTPGPSDLDQVRRVCELVGGNPLAIELAAAWTGRLTPAQIAAELAHSADLLDAQHPDLGDRSRSLRVTFERSWTLLSEREQRGLGALAAFQGGFTREAAADVAGVTVPVLAGLLRRSLLRVHGDGRYDLHALLHLYAAQKADADPDRVAHVRSLHAAHYLALAEQAGAQLDGPAGSAWVPRLDAEQANIRAALDWAAARHDPHGVLRAGTALLRYWDLRGLYGEARQRLTAALRAPGAPRGTDLQARALQAVGDLARYQGEYPAARASLEQAVTVARSLGDPALLAAILQSLGTTANFQGDVQAARTHLEASLALLREHGDPAAVAFAVNNLGLFHEYQGDDAAAHALYDESLALWRTFAAEQRAGALPLVNLARLFARRGDVDAARRALTQSLAIQRAAGDRKGEALSLVTLGHVTAPTDPRGATPHLLEALRLAETIGDWGVVPGALDGLAVVAAHGDPAVAVRLWSAAQALRGRSGMARPQADTVTHLQRVAAVRAALGDAAFADAWQAGERTPYRETLSRGLPATP